VGCARSPRCGFTEATIPERWDRRGLREKGRLPSRSRTSPRRFSRASSGYRPLLHPRRRTVLVPLDERAGARPTLFHAGPFRFHPTATRSDKRRRPRRFMSFVLERHEGRSRKPASRREKTPPRRRELPGCFDRGPRCVSPTTGRRVPTHFAPKLAPAVGDGLACREVRAMRATRGVKDPRVSTFLLGAEDAERSLRNLVHLQPRRRETSSRPPTTSRSSPMPSSNAVRAYREGR